MWAQLKNPNLSTTGKRGFCLVYARNVFAISPQKPTAWDAWTATQFKHTNRIFPNVAVPVWFRDASGDAAPGHVAVRMGNGKIYSSPHTMINGYNVLDSIESVEKHYGVRFVGWSEDLNNVRVAINKEDDVSKWNNGITYNLMYHCLTPAIAERAKAANFVGYFGLQDGRESNQALDEIITSQQWGLLKQEAFPGNEEYTEYVQPKLFIKKG
jgi:hypothetical protein